MIETLKIINYSVKYQDEKNGSENNVVRNAHLTINPGECVGLIGESGSGKSTLALSIMGLLDTDALQTGEIYYGETRLTALSQKGLDSFRWKRIAIVFQNSLDVFNPTLTIGQQIDECIRHHLLIEEQEIRPRTTYFLKIMGLDQKWANAYPHHLSGGMRQKALLAMALSCDPEVLLVDEPTMALDSLSKREILNLLKTLHHKLGFSMLVISHELPVITALTERLVVMYAGCLIEEGPTEEILENPHHPYTKGLIESSPDINPYKDLWGIPGEMVFPSQGCVYCNRCLQREDKCLQKNPVLLDDGQNRKLACFRGGIVTLLLGENLYKTYTVGKSKVIGCENNTLEVKFGEVVSLIGQSGSGKSTLGQILAGMLSSDEGRVFFDGNLLKEHSATSIRGGIQIVLQDPFSSLDDLMSVERIVQEPLDILKDIPNEQRRKSVIRALQAVQLPTDDTFLCRRGYMLSGGQRQRIALARALTMEPKLLIADEISAMLDCSTEANVIRLLKGLQNARGFSLLFITHNIALAKKYLTVYI